MQVNDVDKDAFIAASKPIYDEFGKEVAGREGSDRPRRRARQVDAMTRLTQARTERSAARPRARERFRDGYGRLLEWVVGVLMVVLAVEVTLGVVFRSLGHSLIWYDEVASVLLAWLTFYGSALASVKRAHIGCPEVVDVMPLARAARRSTSSRSSLVIAFFVAARLGRRVDPAGARRRHAGEPALGADERRAVGHPDLGGADRRRRGRRTCVELFARAPTPPQRGGGTGARRRSALTRGARDDDHAAAFSPPCWRWC